MIAVADLKAPRIAMREFAEQWELAEPAVAAFVWSIVPNRHDADDLVQRTAESLIARRSSYDPDRSFVAWAIGAAKIEIRRFRQERGRDRLVFDEETVDAVAGACVQRDAELNELREAIDDCVDRLTTRLKQVLRLRHQEDLDAAAIAERLGLNPGAVSVSLHRARLAVRDCVERRTNGSGDKR